MLVQRSSCRSQNEAHLICWFARYVKGMLGNRWHREHVNMSRFHQDKAVKQAAKEQTYYFSHLFYLFTCCSKPCLNNLFNENETTMIKNVFGTQSTILSISLARKTASQEFAALGGCHRQWEVVGHNNRRLAVFKLRQITFQQKTVWVPCVIRNWSQSKFACTISPKKKGLSIQVRDSGTSVALH